MGLAALGLAAGVCSGFFGIGGGPVIVPVLMIALRYRIKEAVGTSLTTIAAVSLVGVVAELMVKGSNLHWLLGVLLTVGSLLGSWIGGRVLPRLPDAPLRVGFAGLVLIAAYRMGLAEQAGQSVAGLDLVAHDAVGSLFVVGVGAVAGLTSVLFGVGGGIVTIPALSFLFADVPFHAVRATSLLSIVPTAAYGASQHHRAGTVDVGAARCLAPAGVVGAVLGVVCANLLPAASVRAAFAAFLVLAGLRLLFFGRSAGSAARERALSARARHVGAHS